MRSIVLLLYLVYRSFDSAKDFGPRILGHHVLIFDLEGNIIRINQLNSLISDRNPTTRRDHKAPKEELGPREVPTNSLGEVGDDREGELELNSELEEALRIGFGLDTERAREHVDKLLLASRLSLEDTLGFLEQPCRRKCEEALGFKSLKEFKRTLLCKQSWAVLRAKYFLDGSFLEADGKGHGSYTCGGVAVVCRRWTDNLNCEGSLASSSIVLPPSLSSSLGTVGTKCVVLLSCNGLWREDFVRATFDEIDAD
ncbi:UNVERIFIED_CONTAM: hypothetical protein Sindi_0364900 [Sesamum indicum]